jgi:hypothetical protein
MPIDVPASMGMAGWGTFVVALLFWITGLLSGWMFAVSIGLVLLGVVALLTK